jgi:hypothetical protein
MILSLNAQLNNRCLWHVIYCYVLVVIINQYTTMFGITIVFFLAYLQLCDFGFARAMSANTVVLRSIKGIYFSSSHSS